MEAKTRNLLIFGGIFLGLAVGGTIWYFKSKPVEEDKSGDDATTPDNSTNTDSVKVTTNPTVSDITPNPTGKPPVSKLKVYAKLKDTPINVPADNSKVDINNPIKLGATVRRTEKAGELLGTFSSVITIYANPFVVFNDSFSGRRVLVNKNSVSVK